MAWSAPWYVSGPLSGTITSPIPLGLRLACNLAGLMLGLTSVVGLMFIDGSADWVVVAGESTGMPVSGSTASATRLVLVSTVGTVRRQSPTRPRLMIPAISPIALRCFLARLAAKDGSARR